LDEPLHAKLLEAQSGSAHVIRMPIHELMRDRDHRRTVAAGQRVKAGERFEKVDDHIRPVFAHDRLQRATPRQ
jgi:hypothetical protein